jgi:hypothetical protein
MAPPPTTLGTAAPATSAGENDSNGWAWLVLALAVVAVGVGIFLAVRRRNARAHAAAAGAWRSQLARVAKDASVARDLLEGAAGTPMDAPRLAALQAHVSTTADEFARLVPTAPDDASRARVGAAEQALRRSLAAIEGEQFLRDGGNASADALANAHAAWRNHALELEDALAHLDRMFGHVV